MKFLNISDIHLGIQKYGEKNLETEINTRIEDVIGIFNKALEIAISEEVDFIVIEGDIFNIKNPPNKIRELFVNCFKQIIEKHIPVYIIPGNHDSESITHALSSLNLLGKLNNIYIYSEPTVISYKRYNLVFLPWSMKYNVIEKIKEYSTLENSILFGHFTTTKSIFSNDFTPDFGESTIPIELLENGKYIASYIGHIHKRQKMSSKIPIIHVGPLAICNFGELEDGPKGVVVTETKDNIIKNTFIPIDDRKFLVVDYKDINSINDKNCIVKIIGEVTEEERKDISLSDIRNQLQNKCFKIEDISIKIKEIKKVVSNVSQYNPIMSELEALNVWCKDNNIRKSVLEKAKEIIK